MPSFFSKVFGRKKQDDKDDRDSAPLGGPYENISPSVSPSAANFPELVTNGGSREKDSTFHLFKSKSRVAAPESYQKPDAAPHIALNLPSSLSQPEDSPTRALDVVFEADLDSRVLLTDAAIGERRLSPTETLVLIRICARSISARGLETLGIMHPHWYSASPQIQRKLISLYIHSLAAKSPSNTLSPSSSAILSTFESEVEYVRSPHDVAAVLRWALRHLKLDSNCFGREHDWYKGFFDEERAAKYPSKAFSDYLSPRVPNTHLDLLCATFEIFSSLAAHAEANSISGSKLAKYFGLWLLTAQRSDENDTWSTFYARWERSGRMLEHLFLARLRDEAVNHRMPYPYGSPSSNDDLLPRPRFSTQTQLTTQRKPKHSPNKLISDAFEAEVVAEDREYKELWEQIKSKRENSGSDSPRSDGPDFGRVFADDTIRSPTYSLSLSLNDQDLPVPSSPPHNNGTAWHADVTTITPINRPGFAESGTLGTRLAATLIDKDLEISIPAVSPPGKHSRFATSPTASRRSMESHNGPKNMTIKEEQPLTSSTKVAQFSSIQIDEAFIDFWGDALTDPISCNWPPFVLCKLKSDVGIKTKSGKPVDWLPAIPEPQRTTSPRPAKKRFSIFNTGSRTSLDKRFPVPIRKKANSLSKALVGEMGEVLREEDERESPKASSASPQPKKPLESAKRSVSGESDAVPPLPPLPVSIKEEATAVQNSTQEVVTVPELAMTSTVIAAVATAAMASDLSNPTERTSEPASETVDQQIAPSSSTLTAPEINVPQADTGVPAAEPATEPLETVIEAVEEPPSVPQTPPTQPQEVVQEEAVEAEAVVESTSPSITEETSPVIEPVSLAAEQEETASATSFPVVEEDAAPADDEPAPVASAEDETATTVVETTVVEETTLVADESTPVDEAPVVEDEPVETEPAAEPEVVVEAEQDEAMEEPRAEVVEAEQDAVIEEPQAEVVEAEQDSVIEEPQAEIVAAVEEPNAEEGPSEPPSEDSQTKVVIEENGHADEAVPREEQL
ncbi:hypothetical protein F5887DRAFT_981887 [Amanita rubescens]|nr:hypothetical protein F5887DRAFT_981887 [Amanita rubescens]